MERKIIDDLLKWKVDASRKPMLLYGPSLCGKTHTILDFGKNNYKNVIYFDSSLNLELNYVLEKNSTVDKLIRGLSAISLETIFKEESLIIFDNVTEKVINTIKKLFVNVSSYHIIMITNSLDLVNKTKMDGFSFKRMGLVTFFEYLKYIDKEQLISFIEDSFKNGKSMPFHNMAMEAYNDFVLTGGYPLAIVNFKENNDYNMLSSVHEKNINLIKNKMLSLNNLIDIKRGNEVYNNIALQLLKENKKFLYGKLKAGARSKEYEDSIKFLEENNIIIRSARVNSLISPLSKIKSDDSFKLYFNDSGLLYKKMNVNANRLLTNDKLMDVIYENNIVATLKQNGLNIYYYHSDGKAEVDLVVQTRTGKVIPMEIIRGNDNTKSKSLTLAVNKFNIDIAVKFTDDNFKRKKNIRYIPYYAACLINETF